MKLKPPPPRLLRARPVAVVEAPHCETTSGTEAVFDPFVLPMDDLGNVLVQPASNIHCGTVAGSGHVTIGTRSPDGTGPAIGLQIRMSADHMRGLGAALFRAATNLDNGKALN